MPPKAVPITERLERNSIPEPNSGCLLWLAGCDKDGYPQIKVDGQTRRAHRVSWEQKNGPIPSHLSALHRCDVRACINDAHIFPGTQADNVADMMAKGRHDVVRGERHSCAKLTHEQVRRIRADHRSLSAIADDYGMDFGTIGRLKRGETWRHVK